MREIKFRYWDVQTKKMFEVGTLNFFEDGDIIIGENYPMTFRGETLRYLMQYTGLKDKNGKEIFEGDIVNVPYNRLGNVEVFFINGKFNITNYDISVLEVVGNIHEKLSR